MRFLVTGATGMIGRSVCKQLLARGHEVHITTRNKRSTQKRFDLPVKIFEWLGAGKGIEEAAFEKVNGVINLMGEPLFSGIWSETKEERVWDSRVKNTEALKKLLDQFCPELQSYVGASAIGYYPFSPMAVNEDAKPGDHALSHICQGWEEAHQKVRAKNHTIIRIGVVLAKPAALVQGLYLGALGRTCATFGGGNQIISWIHLDDLTELIIRSALSEVRGILNGVAPHPVSQKDLNKACEQVLGKKLLTLPIPSFVIAKILGPAAPALLNSQNVIAKNLSDFSFRYPQIKDALAEALPLNPLALAGSRQLCFYSTFEQYLSVSSDKVWDFFLTPENLEKITDQKAQMKIQKMSTSAMGEGTQIQYSLKVFGVPMQWGAKIFSFNPKASFIDVQEKGPFALWHHEHRLIPMGSGVLIVDEIHWRPPLYPFSILVIPLIKRELRKQFSFRKRKLTKLLTNAEDEN